MIGLIGFDPGERSPIFSYMVPGLNSNVQRNGAEFHVQSEDLGRSKPILQSLVYYGGEVVTILEYTYEELATSEEFCEEEVRRELSDQHRRMIKEIEAGVFDVVDPAAVARECDAEIRQRERILDYLESALTYDRKPCPSPRTDAPIAVEECVAVEEAPISGRPSVDSRGTPVAETGVPRRLVVIRPERVERSERAEPGDRDGTETPQVIVVSHCDEAPQVVPVRQVVKVNVVSADESGVEEVLGQLDKTLERAKPVPAPSHSRRWFVVALPLAALLLTVVGWRWFAGTTDAAVRTPAPQAVEAVQPATTTPTATPTPTLPPTVAELAQARPSPSPEITPPVPEPPPVVAESREVSPDDHGATPPLPAPVEEPAAVVQKDLPPAVTGGGMEEAAAEEGEMAANLTPTVTEIPTAAPDPVERLEVEPPKQAVPETPKVRPGMLIELASVDRAPEPTLRAFPEYPKRARKKGHQGIVELDLLIDEKGNVAEVRVADGGAESELSDAAIDAARDWKYTPARKGPHRVRVWKPVTVHFVLDDHNQSRVRVEE